MPEVHNMVKVPGKWLVIAHSVRKIYTPVTRTWIMNLAHETAQKRNIMLITYLHSELP
jgi:hypothetical protein